MSGATGTNLISAGSWDLLGTGHRAQDVEHANVYDFEPHLLANVFRILTIFQTYSLSELKYIYILYSYAF